MSYERNLNDWISGFMCYTENSEPPRLFRKWTAISCIASALQRKVKIEWGSNLTFYPNFYIVLVGPSATGKGTAMNPGLNILREIPSVHMAAQATSLQALIRKLKETNLNDIDLVTGQQSFHASMTIFSKEFTVFLGYQNRELMSALCDWYDCDPRWVYETISRSKEEIIGVWVNLIAGTTPDLIRSSLPIESIGGGLTSRIIFVFEEKPEKLVTLPTETAAERELFIDLVHDLEQISLLSGGFRWTSKFMERWDTWCRDQFNNPPFRDRRFDGYNGRRRGHLMKLAMVHSVSRSKDGLLILTEDNLNEAIDTLTEVENKMGMVFKGVGKSDIAELVHQATTFLKMSKVNEMPLWKFARRFENDMDKATIDRVIATLEAAKIVQSISRPGDGMYIKFIGSDD
jgi:hypothetical protein